MSAEEVEVSVVIPCLNEARSLHFCIDKAFAAFREHGIVGEVVVGDNGSTDGSIELAREHGARVANATLKGYGHALRKGIEEARGRFIVMGDADDSYDFSETHRFVEKWREGYDVVMGNRFEGGIKPGAMPWHHKYIGNPVLSGLVKLLFNTPIGDSHCGMRGFTKEAYYRMDLRTTGMEFASEFVIKAAKTGIKMAEIPVTLWPDKRGRPPHLRSFRDGWRHLRFILLYAPGWLFLLPGALLMTVGLATVVWLLPGRRHVGAISLDVHTMLFAMMFAMLGMQIITIGLFAKVFAYSEKFDPEQAWLERWLRRVKLEHGLIVGGALTLAGLVGDTSVFLRWAGEGFGEFSAVRSVIFWTLWFFLGIQTVSASIFLSMLGVNRATFIGDSKD